MKLNTSYPKFSEIQVMHHTNLEIKVMHHTNLGTTGTIRRNLQTTTIYHFLHTQIQLHMKRKKGQMRVIWLKNNLAATWKPTTTRKDV
ncbi:hypothetical protein T11_7552 [Trichinella zimbabwensis]|uniref:Uncharacterized protein n=1 Tax=Trichinella zimbabwensis TaxID=268475 RepID=A0A0V1GTU6_9BILA|nr:hypothetical protein T11_7552 [Trichinella zimbabwensis]